MVVFSVEGNDVKVQDSSLSDDDDDGGEAEEPVIEDLLYQFYETSYFSFRDIFSVFRTKEIKGNTWRYCPDKKHRP